MNIKLLNVLKDVGLNENEARVYLALLGIGATTIQNIARAAEIKRTTCYSVIESLKMLGLVHSEFSGFKKMLVAIAPEQLENLLDQRKKKFQEHLDEFKTLSQINNSVAVMQYYEGLEAVKAAYENMIKDIQPHQNYSVIGNQEDWWRLDSKYFEKFIHRRGKRDINIRLLLIDSPITKKHQTIEKNYNEKIKILPPHTKLKANLVITPQHILIHQLTLPIMAIVIDNKSIIKTHQELFEVIWQVL